MNILGRVTLDPEDARGPDVIHRIAVPREWLSGGERIRVTLPRRLACARCEGGGCDQCDRRGAVSLRSAAEPASRVSVRLASGGGDAVQLLRIPREGGVAKDQSQPRGCLMLRIAPGNPSASVELLTDVLPDADPPRWALWIWLMLPVLLLLMWWLINP